MSSFIEAYCNSNQFGAEKWFERFVGLTRIGDLVSDLLFIREMSQFYEVFDDLEVEHGEYYPPITRFLIAASVFTTIGLFFDLYRAYFELGEQCTKQDEENEAPLSARERLQKTYENVKSLPRQSWIRIKSFPAESMKRMKAFAFSKKFWKKEEKKSGGADDQFAGDGDDQFAVDGDNIDVDEDKKGEWKWWNRLNLILEEIPQLIILICFYSAVLMVRDCDRLREKYKSVNCDASNNRKLGSFTAGFSHKLQNTTFPKIIIQTVPDKQQLKSDTTLFAIHSSWMDMNPDFEMLLFDEDGMIRFVDEHFVSTPLPAIMRKVQMPEMKSDLFALAAVAVLGGFYMDIGMLAKESLKALRVPGMGGALFPRELRDSIEKDHAQLGNFAFAALANNEFVLNVLDEAMRRYLDLELAGPEAIAEVDHLGILRTTGSYMISDVYNSGIKQGKYLDVHFIRANNIDFARPDPYGINDWQTFGRFADRLFSQKLLTSTRQLETSNPYPTAPSPSSPTAPSLSFPTAPSPSSAAAPSLSDPTAPSPSNPAAPTVAPFNNSKTDLTADEIKDYCYKKKYIEFACNDEQQEYINGLYVSSVMSCLFTSITIFTLLLEIMRSDRRKFKEWYAASCCASTSEDFQGKTPNTTQNDFVQSSGNSIEAANSQDEQTTTPNSSTPNSSSLSPSVHTFDAITEGWEIASPIFMAVRERRECRFAFPSVHGTEEVLNALSDVINKNEVILGGARATVELNHSVGPVLLLDFPFLNSTSLFDMDTQFSSNVGPRQKQVDAETVKDETLMWVDDFLCTNGFCPYVKSSRAAAVGLDKMGVRPGPIDVRVVGERNPAGNKSSDNSNDQFPAATLLSEFWEAVTTMAETSEETVSTVLLVAPLFDEDFKAFIDVCDGLIEASISATEAATSILGRVWFHPEYDADAVGHDYVKPGHALPHAVMLRRIIDQSNGEDALGSGITQIAHLTEESVARANNEVRRMPHATVNILRRSQLMAVQCLDAVNNKPANYVNVHNIIRLWLASTAHLRASNTTSQNEAPISANP